MSSIETPPKSTVRISNPRESIALGVFLLAAHSVMGVYSGLGIQPSPILTPIYYFGIAWLVSRWITADAKALLQPSLARQGLFMWFLWPIALPLHLFQSRGLRGILPFLVAVGYFGLTVALGWGIAVLLFLRRT